VLATIDEDAALMLQVARGDRRAFTRLFDRHQQSVVRFCSRFVGSSAQAEELAQDVFIKLYRSASSYQPRARFKTYLFRVAANHCLNEVRRPTHRNEVGERTDGEDGPTSLEAATHGDTPQDVLEARDVGRAVNRALHAMSERERAAFTLCRFDGLSYREIAGILGSTESAVKSLIHRATTHVMSQLESSRTGDRQLEGSSV
jgi:RNA polymerase sigma-70 factor (ECF subfamily)